MRPLELQVRFTSAERRECQSAFLSPSRQAHQKLVSRALRGAVIWLFLLAGGGMVALLAASTIETALLQKMVGGYTLLLVLTMVGPYLLEKLRYGKVVWHFGFMDQGWRYFARPSGQQHEGVREWDELLAWYETKTAFHLAYHGQSELQPSPLKKLWSLLNSPVAGLASEARSRQYAMIPKRFLTVQQIGEIRSILTFTTPRGGRSEEE